MFDKLIDVLISVWERIQPIVFILQYQQAVVYRGGKYYKTFRAGWHVRIPGVDVIATETVTNTTICIREVNVTTADKRTVSIAAKFNCEIENVYKAKVLTADWRANIVDVGRGIMSEELNKYQWEDICVGNVNEKIGLLIQAEAKEIGITITKFKFTDKLLIRGFKLFNA